MREFYFHPWVSLCGCLAVKELPCLAAPRVLQWPLIAVSMHCPVVAPPAVMSSAQRGAALQVPTQPQSEGEGRAVGMEADSYGWQLGRT